MPHTRIKSVLYIEDDLALARSLQKRMAEKNIAVDLAFEAEEGIVRMREQPYDVVLLDHRLPGISGITLLERLTPLSEWPPIIVLTSSEEVHDALAALEKGAADYVVKDAAKLYLDLLPAVMQSAYTKDRLMRENAAQRVELEAAKQKAEYANQAKSDFLATMSHEIRTPLNAIVGLASLLQNTQLSGKQQSMISMLNTNADLLLKLIHNLLDLSRIEAGQVELEITAFSMGELLQEIESIFTVQMADKQLHFTLHDHTEGKQFRGDRTRIQQIILNLITNAHKFTDRGHIEVKAWAEQKDAETWLKVQVADSGIGIASDKLHSIFNKFSQADTSISRRFGGSGLGLAISQRLSKLMQGEIIAKSEPGKGSVFTACWPLPEVEAARIVSFAPASCTIPVGENAQKRILLVEDYPANAMVATLMLENLGYSVELADCGGKALEKVRQAKTPYLAILMDVQMNDMDGYEATRRIRVIEKEKGFSHSIIGVTAHALAGDREHCIAAGMDDYMSKPIHPDILAQKLSRLTQPDFLAAL